MFKRNFIVIVIGVLRIITSFLIFLNPLLSFFINYALDSIDGPIYKHYLNLDPIHSQLLDKIYDHFYYIVIFAYLIFSRNVFLPILTLLLIYRLVGFVTFLVFRKKIVFIYTVNFFEFFSYGAILFQQNKADFSPGNINILITGVLILTVYKMITELFLHFKNFTFFDNIFIPLISKFKS